MLQSFQLASPATGVCCAGVGFLCIGSAGTGPRQAGVLPGFQVLPLQGFQGRREKIKDGNDSRAQTAKRSPKCKSSQARGEILVMCLPECLCMATNA